MFGVEHANHLFFFDDEYRRWCNRRRRCHPERQPRQTSLAEEISAPQNPDDGLSPHLIDNRYPHAACLDINDIDRGIALGKDDFFFPKLFEGSLQTGGVKKRFHIERRVGWIRSLGGAAENSSPALSCLSNFAHVIEA